MPEKALELTMFEERLPTHVWADALVRRALSAGAAAFILQRGDASRGDVLVKVAELNGQARLYGPAMGMDGSRVFIDYADAQGVGPDESVVDDYIARARNRDRDLWVIEVEDRKGRHFMTEPIQKLS